jgi:hypothetical protein
MQRNGPWRQQHTEKIERFNPSWFTNVHCGQVSPSDFSVIMDALPLIGKGGRQMLYDENKRRLKAIWVES